MLMRVGWRLSPNIKMVYSTFRAGGRVAAVGSCFCIFGRAIPMNFKITVTNIFPFPSSWCCSAQGYLAAAKK